MNLVTSELTPEEEILLKKYAKLKKKKKSLSLRQSKLDSKESEVVKRTCEIVGVDEQARKLAKLAVMKEALENKEKVFKRPVLKKQENQKQFRPFDELCSTPTSKTELPSEVSAEMICRKKEDYAAQYNRFQKSNQNEDDEQKKGYSIYIHGATDFTEDQLRRLLANHGNILNVKIEPKRAFVCFELKESADMAIEQLDNTLVHNVKLRVGVAKRQPIFHDNHNNLDDPTPLVDSWSKQAESNQQKSNLEDKRSFVDYSDLFD